MEINRITDDGIAFERYPYPPSSICRTGFLPFADISEADHSATPPELRLENGEVVFISAAHRAQIEAITSSHSIPRIRRVDVWSMLLAPFLDTRLPDHRRLEILRALADNGVSRDESLKIRGSIRRVMRSFNVKVADWTHLGLSDLLDAHLAFLRRRFFGISPSRFAEIYWWAMEIAARGRPIQREDAKTEDPPPEE